MAASRRALRLFLFLILIAAGSIECARAALIASYHGDLQLTTPKPGWTYLWNANGAIGDPANYSQLLPVTNGTYTTDGSDVRPAPAPGGFLTIGNQAGLPGGHPGMGALQAGSGGIERYCIALYTISSPNEIAVQNGFLRNVNPNNGGSTDGLNLRIFLNDDPTPKLTTSTAAGFDQIANFSVNLGSLAAGDRIYVAIGSKSSDLFDGFNLRYDIAAVPEPMSVLLAIFGALVATTIWRVR